MTDTLTAPQGPNGEFTQALLAAMAADASLLAMASEVLDAKPETRAVALPYVCLAARDAFDAQGGMQHADHVRVVVWVDVWSEYNGATEVQAIQARIRSLFPRSRVFSLPATGYGMIAGSLVCEEEHCLPDTDPSMPNKSLYHGAQKWVAELEQLA
jgi:hypothetical protein